MSTGTLIAIIVPVVAVLLLATAVLWYVNRRRRLQQRFGPEYERAVRRAGSHRSAEQDLRERERRHDQLRITPLPPDTRRQYTEDWTRVQQEFVDRPGEAVQHADRLVTLLMHDRGYPTEGYEQQLRDLSVDHGRTLEHYRKAHAINDSARRDDATTEELRGAMVHYRALFAELLNGDEPPDRGAGAERR
ncbi:MULTISPECIES: hypothetical protein [Kitasatospora]|uniref:Secreted protein n=1 Tax=Kitasatospora cathayae TaxID=3004092 RepID=A0ABY7PZD6_9ACTN|nr:hypothetical protein [Kitasatospora sp. HUAS 3-15]WBP85311.1 hypothetical protein O1G21_05175 [Kitasatospora sp. HUAS 3-15]